jgi:hypothetical protein
MAKFTTETPISLLVSHKLSFPIVGLKISSLPTFGVISPKIIFMQFLIKSSIYPQFMHAHLEHHHTTQGHVAKF